MRDIFLEEKSATKTSEIGKPEDIIGLEIIFQQKQFSDLDDILNALNGHHRPSYIHSFRVAIIAALMAQERNLPAKEMYVAGAVHDVGKIFVPREILSKPGLLRKRDEAPEMKQHPEWGFGLIADIGLENAAFAKFAVQHHEMLDGSGYPRGNSLKPQEILWGSRILRVADEFGALCEEREYKKKWLVGDALKKIQKGRNRLYDPSAVDALVAVCGKIDMDKRLEDWHIPPRFLIGKSS